MKKTVLKVLVPILAVIAIAQTSSATSISEMTSASIWITSGMSGNGKVILEAKEDAANFILSDQKVRGVALQKALELIRSENPTARVSDLDLAELILAQ